MTLFDRDSGFQFLLEAADEINAQLTADGVLQTLAELIQRHFKPEAVSVAHVEPGGAVVFRAAAGARASEMVGLRMGQGLGIVGWVATHGERLWIPDVEEDERFYQAVDRRLDFQTRAILAIPMTVRGETLAVLELINPAPGTDIEVLDEIATALALLAAPAIENVRLFERAYQAETRYERLFELNPDPIIIIGTTGRIREVNRAACASLGVCPENLSTLGLGRLGLDAASFPVRSREAREHGVAMWEFELAETGRILEARLAHLHDYPAEEGAYLWIGHDITDRVHLERTRQELVNMVVHDLRVPLGNILNSLDLVLTAWREQDITLPIEQVLEIGLRSAHRMEELINDILDSARPQASEQTLMVAEIDVGELVEEAVEALMPSARRRGQSLDVSIEPELPRLEGDLDLLRRVLTNLVGNAVKYTQEGGEIRVSVTVDEDHFRFSVADNGPGIPLAQQAHIFELFFRGNVPHTKGAGIGLAFCKLAVEAHGGRIWLESAVGKGSTFTFTIPRTLPSDALWYQEGSV
ncbi:MAG: ATP-binding protein [Anaerolineae bacterium]